MFVAEQHCICGIVWFASVSYLSTDTVAKPLYVQDKMVLVIIKDAISFHLSKFQGQATALDAKIICKLLS